MATSASTSSRQQFNLRWNNHTNNILQVFMDQLNNEALVDVSLSCEGKFLKAHKMVLSACSPYFEELFKVHNHQPHPIIIFNGICYDQLKLIVEFMYKGEIKVLENDLQSILQTAEVLQVKGLSTVRKKYHQAAFGGSGEASSAQKPPQLEPLFNKVKFVGAVTTDNSSSSDSTNNIDCSNSNTIIDGSLERKNEDASAVGVVIDPVKSTDYSWGDATKDDDVVNDPIDENDSSSRPLCHVVPTALLVNTNLLKRASLTDPFKMTNRNRLPYHRISRKIFSKDFVKDQLKGNSVDQSKHSVTELKKTLINDQANDIVVPSANDNHKFKVSTIGLLINNKVGDTEWSNIINDNNGVGKKNNDKDNKNFDDDLPTTIKVEPLDIKDIDGDCETSNSDDFNNAGSPKLIIDTLTGTCDEIDDTNVERIMKPKMPTLWSISSTGGDCDDSSNNNDRQLEKDDYSIANITIKHQRHSSLRRQSNWLRSGKIPRPPNAFMIFANEWRRKLAHQHPMESNKDISVRLGVMWKNLTVTAKESYYKASRKADEDHKKKYPGYYYSPKEARIRKDMKLRDRIKYNNELDPNWGSANQRSLSSSPAPENTFKLVKLIVANKKNDRGLSQKIVQSQKWKRITQKRNNANKVYDKKQANNMEVDKGKNLNELLIEEKKIKKNKSAVIIN